MLLVKCICGCCFTIKDTTFKERTALLCANCGHATGEIKDFTVKRLSQELKEQQFEISVIPDDATLEVRFNV